MNRPDCDKAPIRKLTEAEMLAVGGGFLVFRFKLVAVKTISWSYGDESPKQ
jgi:hypothetical protein